MRKVPAAPTQKLDAAINRTLKENQEVLPQMLLLYEQAALMKREQHMAYVKAGFTDAQAFELCKS